MLYRCEPIDQHHYRGEHPLRTVARLFRQDRSRLALGAFVFLIKSSPTWL